MFYVIVIGIVIIAIILAVKIPQIEANKNIKKTDDAFIEVFQKAIKESIEPLIKRNKHIDRSEIDQIFKEYYDLVDVYIKYLRKCTIKSEDYKKAIFDYINEHKSNYRDQFLYNQIGNYLEEKVIEDGFYSDQEKAYVKKYSELFDYNFEEAFSEEFEKVSKTSALIKKYPKFKKSIIDEVFEIDMPYELVVEMFGNPDSEKTEETKTSIKRTCYFGKYLTKRGTEKYKHQIRFNNGLIDKIKEL